MGFWLGYGAVFYPWMKETSTTTLWKPRWAECDLYQKLLLKDMYYYSADYQIIQKGNTECEVSKTCAEDMVNCKKKGRGWLF